MEMQIIGIIFIFLNVLILFLLVPLPILVGVYVYKDAHHRRMDVAFWTILSVLLPCLIGFIIYLFARGKYTSPLCPQCNEPVQQSCSACPHCGFTLKDTCPQCGTVVEADWQNCPVCSGQLPEQRKAVPLLQQKERLGWLVGGAILLSLLTMVTMAILFLSNTYI